MKKYLGIFIAITLIMGGISYLTTENIFLTVGVVLLYGLVSYFLFVPQFVKFDKVVERFHECYHFINNFIISLSIKKSVSLALENVILSMNQDFQTTFAALQDMHDDEKLKYLSTNYFPFHVYQLFLQIVELYQEEGGDILEMSKFLLQELRFSEEYTSTSKTMGKNKYIEIAILWLMCVGILIFTRFTLKDFYAYLKNQIFFIVAIGIFMLFVLFSIYVLIYRATNIKLKGYNDHEKII